MRIPLVICVIVMSCAAQAWADETADLAAGTLVRVTAAGERIKGRIVAADAEALMVSVEGHRVPVRVARTRVELIEFQSPRTAGEGALRGGLRGLAFGAVAGVLLSGASDSGGWTSGMTPILAGGAWGSAIGAAIGVSKPGGTWVPVSAERVRVGVAPQRGGGVGVALSLSF